jgi:hypothetical protein
VALNERMQFILDLDAAGAIRGFRSVGDTADRELGRADNRLDQIGGRMQTAGAGMLAFAGVAGTALMGFARASEEAEAEARKLDQAIASNASFAAAGRDPFVDLADSIQDLTGADGDAILGMEGFLGTLGRTAEETLSLTPLVVDLAARFDMELEPAARLVNNAFQGNTARLERLIGQMEEGETVTAALARTVGGFAEREAQSLSGQLNILKQNLGDVAEGIGGGVVGAINDLIGPLTGLVDKFQELDPATQESVGRLATYGTAAIGAVGALSFLSGTVLKMRERFLAVDAATGVATGGLNKLGKAAAAVAVVGAAFAITEIADAARGAGRSVGEMADEISRMTDEGLLSELHEWFGNTLATDVEVIERGFRDLAVANQATAERMRDAAAAAGEESDVLEAMDRVLEETAVGHAQAAEDAELNAAAMERGTTAAGELAPAFETVNEALEANARRNEEARQAQEALTDSVLSQIDAEHRLAAASDDLTTAIAEYGSAVDDATTPVNEIEVAQRRAEEAAIDVAEAWLEASGAARGSAEGNAILRSSLQSTADSLAPDSPLRARIIEFIAELDEIEGVHTSTIRVEWDVTEPPGQFDPRVIGAKGGGVSGSSQESNEASRIFRDFFGQPLGDNWSKALSNDLLSRAAALTRFDDFMMSLIRQGGLATAQALADLDPAVGAMISQEAAADPSVLNGIEAAAGVLVAADTRHDALLDQLANGVFPGVPGGDKPFGEGGAPSGPRGATPPDSTFLARGGIDPAVSIAGNVHLAGKAGGGEGSLGELRRQTALLAEVVANTRPPVDASRSAEWWGR